jgi:HlyD family secretion protein
MKKGIGVLLAVLLVLGVVFGLKLRSASAKTLQGTQPLVKVTQRDLSITAEAAGLVEPVQIVEVKSKASGEVLRVSADSGDQVEAGALLAEIDPRDVQSALDQAQADLQSAQVKAQVTEAHRARMKALKDSQTVTQEEYESAVDSAAAAKAARVRSQAALTLAKERRNDVIIKAPAAGTVLSRTVQPGGIIASATSNVSGGTTLFTMADLSQMQVRANVSEADVGRIAAGQTALITVQAYAGKTFTGKVVKIEPQAVVDQNVTLFPVLVRVDNQEGLLRPGMNAEVQVKVASRTGVVAVPSSAVVAPKDAMTTASALGLDASVVRAALSGATGKSGRSGGQGRRGQQATAPSAAPGEDGGPAVLFVQRGAQIEPVSVSLGMSDWEYTEVKSGLKAGDQVVLVAMAQQAQAQQQQTDKLKQKLSANGPVPGGGAGAARGGGRRGGGR